MKLREEIDAMRTLRLDPIEVLVLPRVLALVIMLPLLGFIANIAGLVGGGLMAWINLGISPALFARAAGRVERSVELPRRHDPRRRSSPSSSAWSAATRA